MAGEVKRKSEKLIIKFTKLITRCVNSIIPLLPKNYCKEDLLELFKKYYPAEWQQIEEMYDYYHKRDNFLKIHRKKIRYKFKEPEYFFYSHPKVRYVIQDSFRIKRINSFCEENWNKSKNELQAIRQKAINKWNNKIEKIRKEKINLEPSFLDAYISLYKHTKNIEERIEILREIQKYDCEKSIDFLHCVNDGSANNQLRYETFKILQAAGHFVVLRKNFKGKSKDFYTASFDYKKWKPEDLVKSLKQKDSIHIKSYDYFISHKIEDKEYVFKLKAALEKYGKSIYCDWIEDSDFLKRKYISEYTKEVLRIRLHQSKNFIYLSSKKANASAWVQFERDLYQTISPSNMFVIYIDDCEQCNYKELKFDENKCEIRL